MFWKNINDELPLVYIRDAVIFPEILVELNFNTPKCINAVKSAENNKIVVVTQKNQFSDDPKAEDLYRIGVSGHIIEKNYSDNRVRVLFESEKIIEIKRYKTLTPFYKVVIENYKTDNQITEVGTATKNNIKEGIKTLINSGRYLTLDISLKLISLNDPEKIINNLVPVLLGDIEAKQNILEEKSLEERLNKTNAMLAKVIKITELEQKVAEKTQEELLKTQKEVFLREELKTIKKELGEGGGIESDDLRKNIENAKMPKEVKKMAIKEMGHLEKTPSFSPEISLIRNYLDWLISMPWEVRSADKIDINEAKKILDEDHYGLEKVKERILEFLSVQMLVGKTNGPILCFVGPPGTGKTSIGKSIARALGKKFIRISLGGVRDEAEIRGHRRTYIGAMPGRIIQGIKQVGVNNPVFMLDEIDKIGSDFRGDPSSALLEALDSEQNSNFSDHYLEVAFDLSNTMFITTANVLDNIPAPLRDRMEVIEFPGYTTDEKFQIAKNFIWPKIVKSHGLKDKNIEMGDGVIEEIISKYTQETGVRNLERELSKVARKTSFLIASGENYSHVITKDDLIMYLGQPKIEPWKKEYRDSVGTVAALAVTEAGGEVLSVEASLIPGGKGNIILTGHLGDVMKESAQAALSYVRSISEQLKIDPIIFLNHDVHVHVPMGAIPKDGPSAGAAIAAAIISAAANKKIDSGAGITGEITLRGKILKIGGIKEKILAARRSGLTKVIIPYSNKNDLSEISDKYKADLVFYYAKNMADVLQKIFNEG